MDKRYRTPGRPSLGKEKKPSRHIISDNDIEIFLHDHPEINASEVFQDTIHSMMPHGPDEIRLEVLNQRKSEIEQELNRIIPEIKRLKERIESQQRRKLETDIESDYEAWYLRSLVQRGIFMRSKIIPFDIYSTIERWIREGKMKSYEIIEKGNDIFISDSATTFTIEKLRTLGCLKGREVIPRKDVPHLIPTKDEFQPNNGYKISFDYELFEKDFFAGKIDGDLPVQLFKAYKPKISDSELKREIKKLMMPFYVNLEMKETVD